MNKPRNTEKEIEIRDVLAIPLFLVATWFLMATAFVGGKWTANKLLIFIGYKQS